MDFKHFDSRNYLTVTARTGYGEWAATYEDAVPDQLDIRVLQNLNTVDWSIARGSALISLAALEEPASG
jgi:hypothetical protein